MATNWLTTVVHLTVLATTVGILGTRITIEVTLMSTQEIYMKGVNVVTPLGSEILVKIFILPTDATTLSASFATPTQPHRRASRLDADTQPRRSAEHTSELQSLLRISSPVFCLKKTTSPH